MVVQGITEYGADSADEILELLHRGNLHRAVEPTAANQVSSRSHAVLQITVEQSEATAHVTGNVRIGKLSMVDLAGSERASKTDNTGQRLKEGANINRSLLALGNCITALADKNRKGHVPFRDSKMTRLLKDSLGGNCRTVMIANISPSHRQFEETVNTLKYANRAKNLKTQVARNVVSVSAHIAEYQRVIMELRNEVADLKSALKQVGEGSSLPAPVNERKQRSLDYVDNLEKQHMQHFKDAILSAMTERRQLLQKLTDHSQELAQARAKEGAADGAARRATRRAAAARRRRARELHAALADVRKQLQQNQQTINEIVATAVQRISSQERLQLLQLLVRGKFLEVMNEEMSTELEMRRTLTQAAMSQGALPPSLMHEAMATESWYAEHRGAYDFHARMAVMEMGGSLRAPSIAQLLDQNLVSPQQATASQNLGELVAPSPTTARASARARAAAGGGKRRSGKAAAAAAHTKRRGGGSAGGKRPGGKGGGGSGAGDVSPSVLTEIVNEGSDRSDSASGSDRRFNNSANSSLQSSRGPTSQRPRVGQPPPAALAALRNRQPRTTIPTGGTRRAGSASESPTHSQPATPNSSRPPSNSRTTTVAKLSVPPQRVKRFKPPVQPPRSRAAARAPPRGRAAVCRRWAAAAARAAACPQSAACPSAARPARPAHPARPLPCRWRRRARPPRRSSRSACRRSARRTATRPPCRATPAAASRAMDRRRVATARARCVGRRVSVSTLRHPTASGRVCRPRRRPRGSRRGSRAARAPAWHKLTSSDDPLPRTRARRPRERV